MENFPANSHNIGKDKKDKPEKEAIEKVVTGVVIQKQKPIGRRFKDMIVAAEFKNTTTYVISDVLLPALKDMIVDGFSMGVRRAVYGDSGPRRRGYGGFGQREYGRPTTTYNRPVERGGRGGMLPDQPPLRHNRSMDSEIILTSREEAAQVLERLGDILDTYEVASVADLHELVGLPSAHTDNKWGWYDLMHADIRQVREGYLLRLPQAEAL